MALTLFGFHNHPQDFAVTNIEAPLEQCVFLLDFSRPLERLRWLLAVNKWVGVIAALLVLVVHKNA